MADRLIIRSRPGRPGPVMLGFMLMSIALMTPLASSRQSIRIGAVALKSGGGAPQVVAYVVAWALFAFQRLIIWEIPFMPARFVWFRAAVSLPFPFLAAAIAMIAGKP